MFVPQQPQICVQYEANRFRAEHLHYVPLLCRILTHRIFMPNVQKRTENGGGGSVCLCLHVQRVFFTSYSQTPCVPAIGLSHSSWPRCHPSLHPRQTFSRTSGPRRRKRGWWCMGRWGGGGVEIEFKPKAVLDVKRHLYLFPKTFSTVLTNTKWHCCHTTANSKCCSCYLFCPNTVIHAGNVPRGSMVPTACRL